MSQAKKAVIFLIIANFIWSAGSPIFKWALESNIHPFTLGFFRFLIPILIIGFFFRPKMNIKARDFPKIVFASVCAISINIGFFFFGIEKTLSINAPIIGSSGPIFLILGSMLFLRERPGRRVFIGNMLGLTGILLIILEPLIQSNTGGSVIGNFFLIISMLSAVTGAILSKELLKDYPPMTITFWAFFIGLLTFSPFFFNEVHRYGLLPQLSFPGITAIFIGGVFSSLIAYSCYYWGLKHISASETSIFAYIDPIAGVIIAAPLIHEYPNVFFLAGSILVFLGIFISEGRLHYHPLLKLTH